MAFPPLGNSDHVVSVSIDFPTNSQQDALFHRLSYDCSCAEWDGCFDHLRDVPWEDVFKLGASAAASELCEWVQAGIDVYIPHKKYQVKPHLSPWFSAACGAAALVHRNHFFCLYQREKSSDCKVQFRQASNQSKSVLETAKLAYAKKTKSPLVSRNLALVTSGELLIVFWTKVNLLYVLYSKAQRCSLLHLIKQNCLLKISLWTLILMTPVSLYLFALLEVIRNCIIFL